jgi:predicted lipoprotein with Yx(FWY)xxD motif
MKLRVSVLVAVALTGLVVSGCSLTGNATKGAAAPPGSSAQAAGKQNNDDVSELVAWQSTSLGKILTDQNGLALYEFSKDPVSPPSSNCQDQCSLTWPPALVSSADLPVQGVAKSVIGTITRPDGTDQLTVAGHPLYRYHLDTAAGQAKGEGVGNTWFAVAPSGERAQAQSTGATLSVAQSPTLGTIVTDADGFTLYRFDHDSPNPPKSTCFDACAALWPAAAVPDSQITLSGVDASVVGTLVRPDGSRQLTIGGWPVYEFSKDTAQGDVKGQGVGGVWFAVTPTGGKNTTVVGSAQVASTAPAGAGSGY